MILAKLGLKVNVVGQRSNIALGLKVKVVGQRSNKVRVNYTIGN